MNLSKIILFIFLIVFFSCNKNEENPTTIHKGSISGLIQKGPFINGTSILISELNENLGQTGKNYTTTIDNNLGHFEINNIDLESQYVELKADGYYFNEHWGQITSSTLTLLAIVDLLDKEKINVNILTHLEVKRVKYLITNGMTFANAKKQAQKEILNIFSISKDEINSSEEMNIVGEKDEDAILLAISIIIQGQRPPSRLTELLARISNDIETDGLLDVEKNQIDLLKDIPFVDQKRVRQHITTKYPDTEIPDFEKYIKHFVKNTNFSYSNEIIIPEKSDKDIKNLLFENDTLEVIANQKYCLLIKVPSYKEVVVGLYGGDMTISEQTPINFEWSQNEFEQNIYFQTLQPDIFSYAEIIFTTPNQEIVLESNDNVYDFPDNGADPRIKIIKVIE